MLEKKTVSQCVSSDYCRGWNDAVDAIPRWISVEAEQKPKHHEEVLCRYVFDGDSECLYAVLTYYAYGDNGYVTGQHFTGEGLHDMRVTHWMPLPEPPEEPA